MRGFLRQLAADHHRDQLAAIEASGFARSDELPVPEHRDPVGNLIDLLQKVGDEDDAEPARLEAPDNAEQHRHLMRIEARRRLVEDQHLAGEIDGSGNGNHLLDRDRIAGEIAGDVDVEFIVGKQIPRAPVHRAHVDHAETAGLAPEEEVLGNRQVRQQVDLLVDRADPECLGFKRIARIDLGIIEQNGAAVAPVGPGQAFDQGRFSGTVFAKQRMNLSAPEVKIDLVEGSGPREGFFDPDRLENVVIGLHRYRLRDAGICRREAQRLAAASCALQPELGKSVARARSSAGHGRRQ